jgi:hypothetical protein
MCRPGILTAAKRGPAAHDKRDVKLLRVGKATTLGEERIDSVNPMQTLRRRPAGDMMVL